MGNVKISELPRTTTLSDADAIPVVQGGVTKKFTGALTALKSLLGIDALNGKTEGIEEDIAEVDGKVVLNTTVPAPIASSGGSTVALEWTHSEGDTSEYLYFIVDGTPVAKIRGMTRIG